MSLFNELFNYTKGISSGGGLRINGFEEVCGPEGV